ncbi:hypothetical protein KUV85_13695 [Nocardioides panacisoli]|uniref:hypothetical protein n=1 Tax=Nocardioides panacisoli TaxID=627624 RepID=UPI001C633289|nr:hypothetical protein [Nocardioides panacisoli]QYJ03375.1 hypothetical protein KUV85_13695 [Nocardioides panacisoli]
MHRTTALRTGIAAGVAAAGLTVGGVALASADDSGGTDDTTSQQARGEDSDGDRRGHGRHGGPFGGDRLEGLADALGVSEDELQDAFSAVRDELRPDGDRDEGERPDRDAMRDALVSALATELDLTEDEVTAALEEVRGEARAEHRDTLEERLDEAVADGDLTEADKESVLKAYDAGVLGGR